MGLCDCFCRRAVWAGVEIGRGVEWQQHRHRAPGDTSEDIRGGRVQLHQSRHRTRIGCGQPPAPRKGEVGCDRSLRVDLGPELVQHRAPFDANSGNRGRAEFFGDKICRTGGEQREGRQQKRNEPCNSSSQSAAPDGRNPQRFSLVAKQQAATVCRCHTSTVGKADLAFATGCEDRPA